MLSEAHARSVERGLAARFGEVSIAEAAAVGGGCISTTLRLRLHDGQLVFLKVAPEGPSGGGLLAAEAYALQRLREVGEVRVPEVLARGDDWLALEWLEPGRGSEEGWSRLGAGLARLHRLGGAQANGFGWPHGNFIGSLPQANDSAGGWAAFWWTRRLEPQIELARARGLLARTEAAGFAPLAAELPRLLEPAEAEGPSLLHGDLWSGNVHMLASGEPAIVDPAAYYGHREVDLAMATLFGGFQPAFYLAYDSAWPLQREGAERRRATYQLYYLLVHVNLFGRGYLRGTMEAPRQALGQ